MDITIRVDDAEVRAALRRLRAAVDDLRPALRDIAAALEAGAEDAFEAQESPAGDPWAPLAASTIRRRERRRKWPGKILQVTAAAGLIGSITSRADDDSAVVGTNKIYAGMHQFGARHGEYRGGLRPIPWGGRSSRSGTAAACGSGSRRPARSAAPGRPPARGRGSCRRWRPRRPPGPACHR